MQRQIWFLITLAAALLQCGCGGAFSGPVGACVVDGTKSCTDDVSVDYCQQFLHGDHFYEARRCKDVGFPG